MLSWKFSIEFAICAEAAGDLPDFHISTLARYCRLDSRSRSGTYLVLALTLRPETVFCSCIATKQSCHRTSLLDSAAPEQSFVEA